MPDAWQRTSPIIRLFSNPWFGGIAALCGIIGIPLSLYLYFAGIESPDLAYLIDASRTSIVDKSQAAKSKITVTYENQVIKGDLSSVQISIWNAGKKAILSSDVLNSFVLTMAGAHIVDAKIVESSRPEIIQFHLDGPWTNPPTALTPNSRLGLSWRILEHNDGVRLQLIYEGDLSVPVTISGAIIGQNRIRQQQPADESLTRNYPGDDAFSRDAMFAFVLIATVSLGVSTYKKVHTSPDYGPTSRKVFRIFASLSVLVLTSIVAYGIYRSFFALHGVPSFVH